MIASLVYVVVLGAAPATQVTLGTLAEYSVTLKLSNVEVKNNKPELGTSKTADAVIEIRSKGIDYQEGTIVRDIKIYSNDAEMTDISAAKIKVYAKADDTKAAKDLAFTGEKVEPARTDVSLKSGALSKDSYSIKCYNNLTTGKAVIVVFGRGKYAGAARGSYKIK